MTEPDELEDGDHRAARLEDEPDAGAGTPAGRHRIEEVRRWLEAVRADRRRRLAGFAVASLVGVGLAGIHWGGLIAGGALVGLFGGDVREAVAAGAGFGVVTWVVFLGGVWLAGSAAAVLGAGRIAVLGVALPVALGGFGALARGLVPSRTDDEQ